MFYRLHVNDDAPCFCADHAYSGLMGRRWNDDGSATWCDQCDGTGWEPALRGYSCCWNAEELIEYFTHPARGASADDTVIVFEGQRVGTGFDGEPLAIPATVVKTLTWAQFVADFT